MWIIFSIHLKVSEISAFMPVENLALCEYCGFTWQVAEHHAAICTLLPLPVRWGRELKNNQQSRTQGVR